MMGLRGSISEVAVGGRLREELSSILDIEDFFVERSPRSVHHVTRPGRVARDVSTLLRLMFELLLDKLDRNTNRFSVLER